MKKRGLRASTPEMELMHGAEKQGVMHYFIAERAVAINAARPVGRHIGGTGGPSAVKVRARIPAKPMNSVFVRKPRAGKI